MRQAPPARRCEVWPSRVKLAGRGNMVRVRTASLNIDQLLALGAPVPTLIIPRVPETLELVVPVDDDLQVPCGRLRFGSEHHESLAVRGDVVARESSLTSPSAYRPSKILRGFLYSKVEFVATSTAST